MRLSVIILNYKVPYYLMHCLASVSRAIQNIDAEIIVVDNHSQDESVSLVNRYFPEVRIIENPTNSGFSRGNNLGVKEAQGAYICLVNPDVFVSENCFAEALAFADAHTDLGILGVKMIDGSGSFLPESKRNIPTPKVSFSKILGNTKNYYSALSENEIGKVEILSGAFMLMKKEKYLEVGGLDEDYFMYGEDIDLSYKFLKKGYQNYYLGTTKIIHYKGESTVKDASYRKRFYGAMKIFYRKHFYKNQFFYQLVSLGAKLLQSNFFNTTKKKQVEVSEVYHNYFIASIDESIQRKLEKKYNTNFETVATHNDGFPSTQNSLLVLDNETVSAQAIINFIEASQSTSLKYRIRPRGFDFIIGSDQSISRGEVVKLD
ncbi:glycosyltransferase family 2 protein [Mesonia sp. K7]|uniref:glycosyltransferase family 2 protein n=1 Tax=Mesonia sp. K7 TaxID=2218606 RepID=UPI000DA8E327|nr:glycosyltransferase family 2 protein [Mesonia sp. K7]PZD77276.1 glycosyltransferase family 2 protein [Mesonia sp. K7]